jgi:hypothetical protein
MRARFVACRRARRAVFEMAREVCETRSRGFDVGVGSTKHTGTAVRASTEIASARGASPQGASACALTMLDRTSAPHASIHAMRRRTRASLIDEVDR